jgi:outer membrane protein OmpA-like peptidoglycan-associated protein
MAKTRNIILLMVLCAFFAISQTHLPPGIYTTTNKKAIAYFEGSKKEFQIRKDDDAERLIQKAIKEDDNFTEAHSAYADFLMEKGRVDEAIIHYEKAVKSSPKMFVDNYFYLGGAYFSKMEYDKAKQNFQTLLSFDKINPKMKDIGKKFLKDSEFASEAMKKPVQFDPVNVGQGINTYCAEYFPSITGDGNYFIFTRNQDTTGNRQISMEDFFISKKINGEWSQAIRINGVNSACNEGAPSISADGMFMFFAGCPNEMCSDGENIMKSYGSCDLYYTQRFNGKWSKPVNIGPPVNTAMWESQPSFSSDGKTLYFLRGNVNRDKSVDKVDIYYSVLGDDGKFSDPVKLNDNINTSFEEESVYIHPDNQTLYFSSEGHTGFGKQDVFVSRREANGDWGPAVNLGYPINTNGDENSFIVDPSGKVAYFASNKSGGFGRMDIYSFKLPKDFQPEKITYVKGKVYNAKTKESVDATIELFDIETQLKFSTSYSGKDGQFFVTLTANKNYMVNVNKPGFLFYSDNFSLKGKETDFNKPYLIEIPLEPIDTGRTVVLNNVFFDVNKWDLKPESKAELDKLGAFLTKNPTMKIELGGHTDNSGDKKFNETLSTNRAKAVYDYLITNNKIAAARLSYKGYAEKRPRVPNDSPENKAKNRRTEFKVISK